MFERLPDIVVVLAFTTRFLCPGFRATLFTMGTVKVPSVDVTDTELLDMEQDQMTDIRASIHGRGSYQLTGQAQVH
jgi:hypothetical protein